MTPAPLGENFGRVVASFALDECGQPAINHAKIAGCQYDGPPTSRCNTIGMDRAGGFDCSGLSRYVTVMALRSVGISTAEPGECGPAWRHVRQMAALAEQHFLPLDLLPGTHLLLKRQYTIGGHKETVAGHMGVIVGRRDDGNFDLVHTVQSRHKVAKSIWRPDKPGTMNHPWGIIPAVVLAQVMLETE